MAKEYVEGEKYYLPVLVSDAVDKDYPVKLEYLDGGNNGYLTIRDKPDLLLTAEEIAANVHYRRNRERDNRLEELERENQELKNENGKLTAKVDDLEADLQNAKATIDRWREIENHNTSYIDKQTQAINRKDKEIEILIDRITKLEAELAEEREKHNG